MAAAFLSTANPFLLTSSSCSTSSASTSSSSPLTNPPVQKHNLILCKAFNGSSPTPALAASRRSLSVCFITSLIFSWGSRGDSLSIANAAILEADDDVELLEKVKKDRQKRIERQAVLNSSNKEKGYLQELVYKLSKVGQAIENNDLSAAGSVLGGSTDSDWVKNANAAFVKLSDSPEEKTEVDKFNSSLATLVSSVTTNNIESSKTAFVSSASAFETWTTLTGQRAMMRSWTTIFDVPL